MYGCRRQCYSCTFFPLKNCVFCLLKALPVRAVQMSIVSSGGEKKTQNYRAVNFRALSSPSFYCERQMPHLGIQHPLPAVQGWEGRADLQGGDAEPRSSSSPRRLCRHVTAVPILTLTAPADRHSQTGQLQTRVSLVAKYGSGRGLFCRIRL